MLFKNINEVGANPHTMGKVIFTPVAGEPGRKTCIDGQQRITTMLLILAAVRDTVANAMATARAANDGEVHGSEAEAAAFESGAALMEHIDRLLFTDPIAAAAMAVSDLTRGTAVACVRLLPTYDDRDLFYALLLARAPGRDLVPADPSTRSPFEDRLAASSQLTCKAWFDDRLRRTTNGVDLARAVAFLERWTRTVLTRLTFVYFELENNEYDAQVFQWLQEKSLLAATMVYNKTPGQDLEATDLIRNLLMSFFVDDMAAQERVYADLWIPLERAARERGGGANHQGIDAFLCAYLAARHPETAEFEQKYVTMGRWELETYYAFSGVVRRATEFEITAEAGTAGCEEEGHPMPREDQRAWVLAELDAMAAFVNEWDVGGEANDGDDDDGGLAPMDDDGFAYPALPDVVSMVP